MQGFQKISNGVKKISTSQLPKREEKEELRELLASIKSVNRFRYGAFISFGLVFLLLKLTGIYPSDWLITIVLFSLTGLGLTWELILRKTKIKERVIYVHKFHFIWQVIEIIAVLTIIHLNGTITHLGALILVAYLFTSYYTYTRRIYYWLVIIFAILTYIVFIILEYFGILSVKDFYNIGVDTRGNLGIVLMTIPRVMIMIFIFIVSDFWSRKLQSFVKNLSQRTKELQQSKGVLETKVKERTKELEEERIGLEGKVQARTKELQERIDDLERFHKLTVGRELKMSELKAEIEKLKKELARFKKAPGMFQKESQVIEKPTIKNII